MEARQILKQYKIPVTQNRLRLLQLFLDDRSILDYRELLHLSQYELERTSIFRTLSLFANKNIIRRIPCSDGVCRYALVIGTSSAKTIQKTAAMICSKCHEVKIVPLVGVPKLPDAIASEFLMQHVVLEGLCRSCK